MEDEFEILKEVLMLVPEERLSNPTIEGDEIIISPIITSELAKGGIAKKKK